MKFRKNFFTEQLKRIMFERKLTQEELGKKLGVNRQQISRWLTTDRNPSLVSIKKLAKALNVSVNYFIEESNKKVKDKTNLKRIENVNMDLIINLIREENKLLEEKIKTLEYRIKILEKK